MEESVQTLTPRRGRPPRATVAPLRDQKFQLALSDAERQRLDAQARAGGYDSVAAFIRARTLGTRS